MSLIATKFGQWMRAKREQAKLSQEGLANSLKLSRISVANYEGGKQSPNLETAMLIASRLKFSLDELMKDIEDSSLTNELNDLTDPGLKSQLKDVLNQARVKKD